LAIIATVVYRRIVEVWNLLNLDDGLRRPVTTLTTLQYYDQYRTGLRGKMPRGLIALVYVVRWCRE